jgi:hypothetical protein
MKPIAYGAVLGVLWLLLGLPLGVPSTAVTTVVAQPVILAFAAGLLARPYLTRPGRWTR